MCTTLCFISSKTRPYMVQKLLSNSLLVLTKSTYIVQLYTYFFPSPLSFLNLLIGYLSGFEVVDKGCCGTGTIEAAILCNSLDPQICEDDSKYVFWDSYHPTQRAYQIVVGKVLNRYINSFFGNWEIIPIYTVYASSWPFIYIPSEITSNLALPWKYRYYWIIHVMYNVISAQIIIKKNVQYDIRILQRLCQYALCIYF